MPSLWIAVVVITRGRPEGCARVVDEILKQELEDTMTLSVTVVDNNDAPNGLCLKEDPRVAVVHEPVAGIPHARNRGVATTLPDADIIAFIDDDEVPASLTWLRDLIQPINDGRADVATGPVVSRFGAGTPRWIASQAVFNRRDHQHGAVLMEAYSGNLACRAEIFRSLDQWFDTQLARSGGSDTEFTRRVSRHGYTISWCRGARVIEFVPEERARPGWVIRRSLRVGANRVQFLRREHAPIRRWLVFTTGSMVEVALIPVSALVAPVSRRQGLALAARAARGIGFLKALLGFEAQAYASVL